MPVPALIGLAFGGVWSVLGAMALARSWRVPAIIAGVLFTLLLLVGRWRSAGSGVGLFRRRAYLVAVALELAGINVAVVLLRKYGLESFLVQALGLVVGLHFIGLWAACGDRRYLWICGGMCICSLLGTMLPDAAPGTLNARDAVTAYGCAFTLWFAACPALHGPGGAGSSAARPRVRQQDKPGGDIRG